MPWGSARGPWRQRWRGRTKALRRSAAGDAHVAGDGRLLAAAVDDEVVALGLAADGLEDGGVEQDVALDEEQRRAKVGGVLLAEATGEFGRGSCRERVGQDGSNLWVGGSLK